MIIYNPGNSPVVYSDDGKILGGDERVEVASLDKHGKRAVAHGYIVVLDEEKTEEEGVTTEAEEAPDKDANAPAQSGRRTSSKTKAKAEGSGASAESETD
jgi:hypothetical protein